MSISERFGEGCKFIGSKILWIVFIPIVLDLANLFSWEKVYHTVYHPVQKLFVIKLGFIEAPPSVSYLLENFPTPLFKYDNSGVSGIISRITPFNAVLFITVMIVESFLHSGYLNIIGTSFEEKVRIRDFFIKGNRKWHKFFLLDCVTWIPIMLAGFNKNFIFLSFINVIFVYVEYSFVADEVSILKNFLLGIEFLFNNLGLTIKMALYFGLIFSPISLVVFPLANLGTIGIVIDIIICAYFGAATNRAVFEIYAAKGKNLV
jgi:hypothetical protein